MGIFLLILLCLRKCPNVFYAQPIIETLHVDSSLSKKKTFSISTGCHLKCSHKNSAHFHRVTMPTFSLLVFFELYIFNSLICLVATLFHQLTSSHIILVQSLQFPWLLSSPSGFISVLFNYVKLCFLPLPSLPAIPHPPSHSHRIFHFPAL